MDTIAFGVGVRKVSWPDGYGTPTFAVERRRGSRVIQEMAAAQWFAVADELEKSKRIDQILTWVVF
ncbi:hypothetical protein ACTJJN_01575 [Pseudomonas sp. 22515]|uniref:hypothetical protein n=1 Tax=Pseudomonas sp. 22515 TaxID=3453934 RepID=UPI003F84082E